MVLIGWITLSRLMQRDMFKLIPPKILGAIIFVSLVLPIDPLYAVICIYWNLVVLVVNHGRGDSK